jgi:malate dehydrogenase
MANKKVGIIGAGSVGATAAYTLAMMGKCDEITLFDIADGVAQGKAIDIAQSSYYAPNSTIIKAANKIEDVKDCDIVVITAGVPRTGDMTREDLLMINANIVKDVTVNIKETCPNAIIICVSNPLDVMTYVVQKITGWDSNRVVGMAGALDGSRMAYQITKSTGLDMQGIDSLVIGDHGVNMIPRPEAVNINGKSLSDIVSKEEMENIIERTRNGGAEIVSYLKTSGYYGPGRGIVHMIDAIFDDTKEVVASSVYLNGEYGHNDVCVGVPVVLGSKGVESIIKLDLDQSTQEKFNNSVQSIKDNIKILNENNFFEGI